MKKLGIFLKSSVSVVSLFLLAGCASNEKESPYMAVRLEESNLWSIVDVRTGDIIHKDAFSEKPENITEKMFSMKTSEGKYECYSMDDINNPVGGAVFSAVGKFYSGNANAVREGAPISKINEKAEDVFQYSKEITALYEYSDGLAKFLDRKTNNVGFVDEDGNIVIPANFDNAYDFSDGYAVVIDPLKEGQENNEVYIVNKKGEKVSQIDVKKYSSFSGSFSEGLMAVCKDKHTVLINPKGEEVLTNNQMEATYNLDDLYKVQDGKFIFKKNSLLGLMNIDGEVLVRARYDELKRVGADRYVAKRNGEFGVINGSEEEIVPFEYSNIIGTSYGTYFVCENNGIYYLINEKGEELTEDIEQISLEHNKDFYCKSEYVDIDFYVNELDSAITHTDVFGINKQTTAAVLGKKLNLEPQYFKFQSAIALNMTLENISVKALFDGRVVEDIRKQVSYGYFTSYQIVGQKFGDETVASVSINVSLQKIHCDKVKELLTKRLTAKGFKQEGGELVSKDGLKVSFTSDPYSMVIIVKFQ